MRGMTNDLLDALAGRPAPHVLAVYIDSNAASPDPAGSVQGGCPRYAHGHLRPGRDILGRREQLGIVHPSFDVPTARGRWLPGFVHPKVNPGPRAAITCQSLCRAWLGHPFVLFLVLTGLADGLAPKGGATQCD